MMEKLFRIGEPDDPESMMVASFVQLILSTAGAASMNANQLASVAANIYYRLHLAGIDAGVQSTIPDALRQYADYLETTHKPKLN